MSTQPAAFDVADQVRGIDVSHNNGMVDWTKVAAGGIHFAIAKATEGQGFTDSQFKTNYSAIKTEGMIRGAYHFFRPKTGALLQAQNFLKAVQAPEAGDLPPTLDVEVHDDQSAADIIAGVREWIDAVGTALNCTPMVYTSASFWNASLDGANQFAQSPLWVAHYTTKPQPNLPAGFAGYTIWQFTEHGAIDGISGTADLNRFNGTLEQLRTLAGL